MVGILKIRESLPQRISCLEESEPGTPQSNNPLEARRQKAWVQYLLRAYCVQEPVPALGVQSVSNVKFSMLLKLRLGGQVLKERLSGCYRRRGGSRGQSRKSPGRGGLEQA